MAHRSQTWLPCFGILLVVLSLPSSLARVNSENRIKTASFNAEVVDEAGNPIPLHETYLHHWVVARVHQRKGVEVPTSSEKFGFHQSDLIVVRNSGICETGLGQYFGLGSETRRTATHVPDPYGIEVGNPAEIPPGYEEKWMMNVHAIDTRGVEDRLRDGFESTKRSLFMRYTVEYDVESFSSSGLTKDAYTDTKTVSLSLPTGGTVVYGVAHQHTGGIGSTLYGEDGRVICSSIPTYGEGKEAGNEAGYIVGMSTCYPNPGSVEISDGETLVLVSNYSREQRHTGVMGLFYILVADASPKSDSLLVSPVEKHEEMKVTIALWGVAFFGVAIAIAVSLLTGKAMKEWMVTGQF
ncbi:hypothetical protein C3L33_00428, partial [Rhododendron williamsianum]